jgi:hypothetical protein
VVSAVLVAVAIIIVTSGGGESDSSSSESSSVGDQSAGPSAAEECVEQWNSGATDGAKQIAGSIAQNNQGDETSTYVTAGFSADVQDRCLITVVQPDLGTGVAFQYVETAEGSFAVPSENSESIASLPESVKQWNARGDRQGNLSLGAP